MEKAVLGTIFFHNVERVELSPLQRAGDTTWHDLLINGEKVISLSTKGKDLIPHVVDKEALSNYSFDS
tara:strand:+ start:316 stop:519 length:204 start_codon:yes stop_codon:yes gene_type:complete